MTDGKFDGQRLAAKVDELEMAFNQLRAEVGAQASDAVQRVEDAINEIREQIQEFRSSRKAS